MEKINTKISMEDYKKAESRIDYMNDEEEFIETHKKLVGNSCKNEYWEIKDCGVNFIKEFLSRDWGRSIVYEYSEGAKKFIKSKYLSDYFKTSIKELLANQKINEELLNILNSEKSINDMSEEEITLIYSTIKDTYAKTDCKIVNVASQIMPLLYKLDGSGVASFLKNNVSSEKLASQILLTSGLSDRASYYSGRGVKPGDLNENNLVAIFNKLIKIDINYGVNFVEMVQETETLGATEFINSFMNFASNNFFVNELIIENNNISLDGLDGEARNAVGFISIFESMNSGNYNYQIMLSNQMKRSFLAKVMPVLQSIVPDYGLQNEDADFDYSRKISQ